MKIVLKVLKSLTSRLLFFGKHLNSFKSVLSNEIQIPKKFTFSPTASILEAKLAGFLLEALEDARRHTHTHTSHGEPC